LFRTIAVIFGIILAAIGGAIAYRALFLEPTATYIVTNTEIRNLPNTFRVAGGIALLITGACIAFLSARKKRS